MRLSPLALAPIGSTLLPPAPLSAPVTATQLRPTSLPRSGVKTVPPPDDLNVRLRALDALLGDMSLVPSRLSGGNAQRTDALTGSLRIVREPRQIIDADSTLGMPTPKPRSVPQVMAFD